MSPLREALMATSVRVPIRTVVATWKTRLFSKRIPGILKWTTVLKYQNPVVNNFIKVPLSIIIPTMAAASVSSPEIQKLIDESEVLFENKDFPATYSLLLPHKDNNNAEILWRLARAATEKGKMGEGEERKKMIYEAWDYITKALELDDNNFACHKWYGILLDYTGEYEGTKQRIANAFKVKEHFMRAIELNPKDATTMYCLGFWCFLFADMPWYQRKIAAVLFASPPTSSYEEALEYFKRAEKTDPGFYNQNVVMLGKTYLRLKDKETAKTYLLKALEHEDKTSDDTKVQWNLLKINPWGPRKSVDFKQVSEHLRGLEWAMWPLISVLLFCSRGFHLWAWNSSLFYQARKEAIDLLKELGIKV